MLDPLLNEMKTVYQKEKKNTMGEKLSIAVLLSTYNGEKYLRQQIESILAQRFDNLSFLKANVNLELYIRDDGSKDNTKDILQEYERRDEVHVFFGENVGITASYFELIKLSGEHDYYSLSDQDDVWLADKLECALKALEEQKRKQGEGLPLLYGCQSYLVDENLKKTGQLTQKQLRPLTIYNTAIQNILLGHNQVFNTVLAKVLSSKELDYSEIYAHDMWITQVASITGKIIFENEPHTFYRQHGENELGYGGGAGTIRWLIARIRRVGKGESRLVGKQARYLSGLFNLRLQGEIDLKKFFSGHLSFFEKCRYLKKGKLYRQKKNETVLFNLLYLADQYSIIEK